MSLNCFPRKEVVEKAVIIPSDREIKIEHRGYFIVPPLVMKDFLQGQGLEVLKKMIEEIEELKAENKKLREMKKPR